MASPHSSPDPARPEKSEPLDATDLEALVWMVVSDEPVSALVVGSTFPPKRRRARRNAVAAAALQRKTAPSSPSVETLYESGRRRILRLMAHGFIHRLARGSFMPSERGRLAAALALASDPVLRRRFLGES